MSSSWMIYGAYGYSGELIAREAVARGLTPLLAGRNRLKLESLAKELGLAHRVFDLSDTQAVEQAVADQTLVLHCAGPFSRTAAPMLEACLNTGTHYFDITGEIDVFEYAHSDTVSSRASAADIIVCPGVGFDVVPTDCLAVKLKDALPDATSLELAFKAGGPMSPGTAKTSVESMAGLSRVRRSGRIVETPLLTRKLTLGGKERSAMSIPWGDVSTAYTSTGIGDVTVYVPVAERTLKRIRRVQALRWLLGLGWVQTFMKNRITKTVQGPDADQRAKARTYLWGEVRNAKGDTVSGRFETPNGYDLTVTAPLAIVEAALDGDLTVRGSVTPSQLMSADFVWSLPGVTPLEMER